VILATMALAIIFMGVASPLFTRRMEVSTNAMLEQMKDQMGAAQEASRPAALPCLSPAQRAAVIQTQAPGQPALATVPERQVAP